MQTALKLIFTLSFAALLWTSSACEPLRACDDITPCDEGSFCADDGFCAPGLPELEIVFFTFNGESAEASSLVIESDQVTVAWTANGASICALSHQGETLELEGDSTRGTLTLAFLDVLGEWNLTCTNGDNIRSQSATIVAPALDALALTFTINNVEIDSATSISQADNYEISWQSNAEQCQLVVDNEQVLDVENTGSLNLEANNNITIACLRNDESVEAAAFIERALGFTLNGVATLNYTHVLGTDNNQIVIETEQECLVSQDDVFVNDVLLCDSDACAGNYRIQCEGVEQEFEIRVLEPNVDASTPYVVVDSNGPVNLTLETEAACEIQRNEINGVALDTLDDLELNDFGGPLFALVRCTSSSGSAQEAFLQVSHVVRINRAPDEILRAIGDQPATFTWDISGADRCTLNGDTFVLGEENRSARFSISNDTSTTFSFECFVGTQLVYFRDIQIEVEVVVHSVSLSSTRPVYFSATTTPASARTDCFYESANTAAQFSEPYFPLSRPEGLTRLSIFCGGENTLRSEAFVINTFRGDITTDAELLDVSLVTGDVTITGSNTEIYPLLQVVHQDLVIAQSDPPSNTLRFPLLKGVVGDLHFRESQEVEIINLPLLESVGTLTIVENTDLDAFYAANLSTVTRDVAIFENPELCAELITTLLGEIGTIPGSLTLGELDSTCSPTVNFNECTSPADVEGFCTSPRRCVEQNRLFRCDEVP